MVVNVKNNGLCPVRFSCLCVNTLFFVCAWFKNVTKKGLVVYVL